MLKHFTTVAQIRTWTFRTRNIAWFHRFCLLLEEQVLLFGASTSGQQASKTVDEHHQAREEMENQREGLTKVHVPAFTVRHVVVLLTTDSLLAGLGMHAERVKKSNPTGCVVLR